MKKFGILFTCKADGEIAMYIALICFRGVEQRGGGRGLHIDNDVVLPAQQHRARRSYHERMV